MVQALEWCGVQSVLTAQSVDDINGLLVEASAVAKFVTLVVHDVSHRLANGKSRGGRGLLLSLQAQSEAVNRKVKEIESLGGDGQTSITIVLLKQNSNGNESGGVMTVPGVCWRWCGSVVLTAMWGVGELDSTPTGVQEFTDSMLDGFNKSEELLDNHEFVSLI